MATHTHTLGITEARGARRSGSRAFVPILLGALALNGAVLVWLWLRDGGITQVHDASELWTSAGRITGLAGAYFALLQVLLVARLPPLERQIGFDRLTVWHRRNGKLTLWLVIAHVVLITVGYAGEDRISILSQFSSFLSTYVGMITATIGTGLMIAIVFSSIIIVRRRLPYEAWYGLHLVVYASIYLAYLHQIPSGNEFFGKTIASDWWLALYVATLVLLLAFRVLRPALLARRHQLRVADVVRESPDTVSIRITGRHLEKMGARAGQFMLWRFLTPGRWWQAHPFSLSAAPDGDSLRITVKGVGGFTAGLAELAPGTRVLAEGPFGRFVADRRRHEQVTLIAGGIGLTPLRAILEELHGPPGSISVLHRIVTAEEAVLRDEIERLAHERGAAVHYVIGDHRDPENAGLMSPSHLRELVPEITSGDVFLCGPPRMMEVTETNLRAAGVPAAQIHSERFALAM